ncbi:MAG: diaminopimelate decarboxylase [Candidatus Omnitrophica bacterium]|nr:diaminopimelate decarboxylase [Candidatus Omnitrophota bacterium]
MHDFSYRNEELYCEGIKVSAIAKKVGTPVYIYSYQTLVDHFRKIKEAFRAVNPIICFAMKANSNLAILKALANEGAGFDIVSGGELKKARLVGADMKKIAFASVGKTDGEIADAIKAGILLFNVESKPELENINRIAGKMKKTVQVALRVNPDIDAPTHDKINTGSLKKKFGIDLKTARKIFLEQKIYKNLHINGVHIHIGSQITKAEPFLTAIKKALAFVDGLEKNGIKVDYFDIGGGLGIVYNDETPQTAREFADKVLPLLKGRTFRLLMEPGRFIVGNAGIFITRKLYLKDNGVKKFMIVDAGMNDLVRPSMYGAYHEIIPVKPSGIASVMCDVVGPICESGDVFAHDRRVMNVKDGDFLALLSAGAYGYVMSSNYNVRPRAAEVMVKGRQWAVVQERENFKDLIKGASIPEFISH